MSRGRAARGRWIETGLHLGQATSEMSEDEARAYLSAESRAGGGAVANMRRMMRAALFVTKAHKKYALTVDQVTAPYAVVEALRRLEMMREHQALAIGRDVLIGKIGLREMQEHLAIAENAAGTWLGRAQPTDWQVFAQEAAEVLVAPGTPASLEFAPQRNLYSRAAQILKVDLEITLAEGRRLAAFISPKLVFSEYYGKSLDEQAPRIFWSTLHYERVAFLFVNERECHFLRDYENLSQTKRHQPLQFAPAFLGQRTPAEIAGRAT